MRITRAPRATLHLSKSIQQSRQNVSRVCHQTVRLLDRLEKSENNRKRFSRRTRPELVSPSRFLSTAVGAEAMAAVDNLLFAEDDFSAFAPDDGIQAPEPSGWHGEPTGPVQPPSPLLDAAQRKKLRSSRHGRRDPGKRERRDGQRRRALEARNEALEREISSLRRASETRADEALATRASALRHLRAAEDHVGLLVKESAGRLRRLTLAVSRENERLDARRTSDDAASPRSARKHRAWTTPRRRDRRSDEDGNGDAARSPSSTVDAMTARSELAAALATQAEMDAEAEEREEELRDALARVEALEAMLREAGLQGRGEG